MAGPLGYINSVQDPSGPLPSSSVAFALALTQGAGKAIVKVRDPTPRLNAQAFVWANIGAGPVDLYLKVMMLRAMRSGDPGYIDLVRSSVGADSAAPLAWGSDPVCRRVWYFKWNDYGTIYLFDDATDLYSVSASAYSSGSVAAVGPDAVNWGHVWKPFQDAWAADGASFLAKFNALRSRGTTYQFVGWGYGGSLAHLFARYVGAAYNYSPSLIMRIGSGPMGRADYRDATKLPPTVDLYHATDPYSEWPPRYLGRYKLGQFQGAEEWFRPVARFIELFGTSGLSTANQYVSGRNAGDVRAQYSLAPAVLVGVPPPIHTLASYASILWKNLRPTQQSYAYLFDLHSIEAPLSAGGF